MLCLAVHNCEIEQHTHVPYVVLICRNARHSPDTYSLLKYEISTQVLLYLILEKSGRKQPSHGVYGLQAMHELHDYMWSYHNNFHIGQAFFHC